MKAIILAVAMFASALLPQAMEGGVPRKDSTAAPGAVVYGVSDTSAPVETFARFLDEVLKNNPRLIAAKSRTKSVEARVPQAGAWDDPLAGVEFYATPVTSANPFKDGMETDYFIQQMIPFPGKKGGMSNAASAAVKMSGEDARAVGQDLIAAARRAYAMLFSAQRRIAVNEENRVLIGQIIESARSKYRVGSATQADVLKAQVEEAQLQNERSVLDQELASAVAMMNALRAVPAGTAIGRLEEIALRQISEGLDTLSGRAVGSRPEILSMNGEIEMNTAELAAAKKEWYPDLMIKGTYKQMKEQTDQWAAMIGINIPVAPWGIGKYSGRVEENEAKVRASEQSLEDMKNMVLSEVRNAHAKVRSGWERIERYRTVLLPQAEQSFRSTLASYQNDEVDFLSLLDSFRMLQMLRTEYYMVEEEYQVNLALLERAAGGSLQ